MIVYRTHADCSDVKAPRFDGDVGYDVAVPKSYAGWIINPAESLIIDTGVVIIPKEHHYVRVESRSSRFKFGIATHGIIDNGYRGTVKIVLWNISSQPYIIGEGEYICQFIPTPIVDRTLEVIEGIPYIATERGENGFGSTTES